MEAYRTIVTPAQRLVRDLDAAASLCAIAVAFVLMCFPLAAVTDLVWPPKEFFRTATVVWLVGLALYAVKSRVVKGCFWALVEYHLIAVPSVIANIVLIGATAFGAALLTESGACGFIVLLGVIPLFFFWNPMRRLNERARQPFGPLADAILETASDRKTDR